MKRPAEPVKATVGRFSGGEEGERSTGGYGPCGPGRTTVVSGTTSEAIEETTPRVRSRAAALAAAIADASPLARSSIWDAKEEEAAVAPVFVVAAGAEAEAAGAEAAEEEKRRRRVRGRRKAPREAEYHGYGRRFDLAAPARLERREEASPSISPCGVAGGRGGKRKKREKVRSNRRGGSQWFRFLVTVPSSLSFPVDPLHLCSFPVHALVGSIPLPTIVESACAIKSACLAGRRRECFFSLLRMSPGVATCCSLLSLDTASPLRGENLSLGSVKESKDNPPGGEKKERARSRSSREEKREAFRKRKVRKSLSSSKRR